MATFGNLKLDNGWDIIPGKGMTRVVGVEYIAQLVKSRLLTLYGEWDLDLTIGVPPSVVRTGFEPVSLYDLFYNFVIRVT